MIATFKRWCFFFLVIINSRATRIFFKLEEYFWIRWTCFDKRAASFSSQITYILHKILSLSLFLFISYIAKSCKRECPILRKKSLNQVSSESVHVPRVFFTRSSMILGTWAPLQKSHGVKDIAMRHWGVLRSSVREVGYLVVSSHTLPMLSTQIPFLHVYTDILYIKEKK